MLALSAGNPFANIHGPALIAATHFITLGFISMIMLGALQQVLPVMIGTSLPAPRLLSWLIQLPLVAGTLLLAGGFLLGRPALLSAAWPALGLAFAAFISAALFSLAKSAAQNASKTAIILSILALSGTVVLGMLLSHGYSTGMSLNYAPLLLHISASPWVAG